MNFVDLDSKIENKTSPIVFQIELDFEFDSRYQTKSKHLSAQFILFEGLLNLE